MIVVEKENVNQSWANIDVLLKQRYDMLPNLESIVKEYEWYCHEKDSYNHGTLVIKLESLR